MHRIATAITLAATLALAPVAAPLAQAQPKAKNANVLEIPVAGTAVGELGSPLKFAGTFTLQRFAVGDDGKVVAVGMIAGTVTDELNNVVKSGLQNVSIPVVVGGGTTATRAAAISAAAVCPILHLDLGPLALDLLGLNVNLSQVVLDITAVSGAGNLLGNLLCAVAGLLDNPTGLAAILNQIAGILAGLGL